MIMQPSCSLHIEFERLLSHVRSEAFPLGCGENEVIVGFPPVQPSSRDFLKLNRTWFLKEV